MATTKERIARENHQKVLRRRAESRYLSTLASDLDIQRLALIQQAVAQEAEQRAAEAQSIPIRYRSRGVEPSVYATEPETLRLLNRVEFPTKVTAVTHVGATLWSAEEDGTIAVRSGITGESNYVIPAVDSSSTVTVLFATPTHVWAGYSSGLVRVFDNCAFVNITEGSFHSGAVTCFVSMDAYTLSAAADGCLVKWDVEDRGFAAMFKIDLQLQAEGILSMANSGQVAYVGTHQGNLLIVDTVTSEIRQTVSLPTHAAISAMACSASGILFTGSSDSQFSVWRGAELLARHATSSPIVCITVDDADSRVWCGCEDGTISVWLTSESSGFVLEKSLPPIGSAVSQLHVETILDAVKIWSLGSNGLNKMWYSSHNRNERKATDTIAVLKAIATQDGVEIDKWRDTVAKLTHISTRRKLQLARILFKQHEEGLRRRYMWAWRRYLIHVNTTRRNKAVSQRLEADHLTGMTRRHYVKWFEWFHTRQKLRVKTSFSRLLLKHATTSSVNHYFAKLQTFVRLVKAAKKRRDLIVILGLQSQRTVARNAMRKWLKFTCAKQTAARKRAFIDAMMRTSTLSMLRLFFVKWSGWRQRRLAKADKVKICETLLTLTATTRRRFAYMQWWRFIIRRQGTGRKRSIAAALVTTTDRGFFAQYLIKWHAFLLEQKESRISKRRQDAEEELEGLRVRYADLRKLIDKKRRQDAEEEQLQKDEAELQEDDVKILRLNQSIKDMEAELDQASAMSRQRQQSVAEQFATLIGQLKSQVINFHQDAAIITSLREKAKSIPVSKTFLEAHQEVKRVVVDLTGKAHLAPDEPWPLTQAKLIGMPPHLLGTILGAIKTMIVCFDMMDRATRDSLETDKEIVINAPWLLQMATLAYDYRRRTMGRGALRAK